jgi:uncharacterized repeat protein (TIGR03803 family)
MIAGCAQRVYSTPLPDTASHDSVAAHALGAGGYELLYRFKGSPDADHPQAGLINVNGTFYGTTVLGGVSKRYCGLGCGTVFKITPSGNESIVYRFQSGTDGWYPYADLIDVKGTLYGTTGNGGGSGCEFGSGCGAVFKISSSGQESVLYSFQGGNDGAHPFAGLTELNGNLYGTTDQGGTGYCLNYHTYNVGCGTVFEISASGSERVVYSFQGGADGAEPVADLLEDKGTLFGTTQFGGASNTYCAGYNSGCGTVFKVSTSGKERVVYRFQGADGAHPLAGLIKANGSFYGTTRDGGSGNHAGTVFKLTRSGKYQVLYSFQNSEDGAAPFGGLVAVNGTLYGTTFAGGSKHQGTIYSISKTGREKTVYDFAYGSNGSNPAAGLLYLKGWLYGTASCGGNGCDGVVFRYAP